MISNPTVGHFYANCLYESVNVMRGNTPVYNLSRKSMYNRCFIKLRLAKLD